MRTATALLPLGLVVACNQAAAPLPPPVVVAVPAATAEAPPPPPPPSAAPAPSAAPSAAPAPDAQRHEVSVQLRPGDPPCKLVFDAEVFNEDADGFVAGAISRIATAEGGACAARVLYELTAEKKPSPDVMDSEPLSGGPFRKPWRPRPAGDDSNEWNHFQDMNFDGYADLCVVVMTGAYNYSQLCWLFDPAQRTFVREKALDPLIFMELHPKTKTLTARYRAGGPNYFFGEWAWQKKELVPTREEWTTLGERPDGRPIPKGFDHWMVRKERRGGQLVKVFEGPEKDKP